MGFFANISEMRKGLIALWLSTIIPVIYVLKNFIFKFDAEKYLNESEYNDTMRECFEKFKPLLAGTYVDIATVIELCAISSALITIYLKPLRLPVLLLPYVICTCAWSASAAGYISFFIIWTSRNSMTVITCIFIYTILILHAYFALAVLKLSLTLNQKRRDSITLMTVSYRNNEVNISFPKVSGNDLAKPGRKSCPSVLYSDLLQKFEPYSHETDEQRQ